MPGGNYYVFENLRPPVCINDKGRSPIRGGNGKKISSRKSSIGDSTSVQLVHDLTDDGLLTDKKWNHHF